MAAAESSTPADATIRNVLFVEDEPHWAEQMRSDLEALGYTVRLAKDGGGLRSELDRYAPDLLILDLILPRESGFEICHRLRQTHPSLPVLIVTSIDMADSRNLAGRVGADGYVVKPWTRESLAQEIASIVKHRSRESSSAAVKSRIKFQCACGKKMKVSAQYAGRMMSCPQCGEAVNVPPA